MRRVVGKNKDEVSPLGAVSNEQDPFYSSSPSDHQHQYAEDSRLLELLGTFTDTGYPPCRIFAIGNAVFLHGVISSSAPEANICEIPSEFLPGSDKLPLFLLTPQDGTGNYTPIFIDTDGILKFSAADTWVFVELSMLRYIKE